MSVPFRETQARYLAVDFLLSVFEPVIGRPISLVTDDSAAGGFFETEEERLAGQQALEAALGGPPPPLDETPVWQYIDRLRERFPNHPDLNAVPPPAEDDEWEDEPAI